MKTGKKSGDLYEANRIAKRRLARVSTLGVVVLKAIKKRERLANINENLRPGTWQNALSDNEVFEMCRNLEESIDVADEADDDLLDNFISFLRDEKFYLTTHMLRFMSDTDEAWKIVTMFVDKPRVARRIALKTEAQQIQALKEIISNFGETAEKPETKAEKDIYDCGDDFEEFERLRGELDYPEDGMTGKTAGIRTSSIAPNIADKVLRGLENKLILPRLALPPYTRKHLKGKIGDTIHIKKPCRHRVGSGAKLAPSPPCSTIELKVKGDHFYLDDNDMDRTMQAGIEKLANLYDKAGAEELGHGLYYTDGTPGDKMTAEIVQLVYAHLEHVVIPSGTLYAIMDPLDIVHLSDHLEWVNSPPMDEAMGKHCKEWLEKFEVCESSNIPIFRVADRGASTPLVRGADQAGGELATDGWANNDTKVLNKGQLIQIAGVKEVEPRGNHAITGNPMTFTVLEDVTPDATGQATIKIYPDLNDGSNTTTDQNVDAKPKDKAAITVLGDSGKSYRQAFFCKLGVLEYFDVQPSESAAKEKHRVDALFGVKCVYPELGIRVITEEV